MNVDIVKVPASSEAAVPLGPTVNRIKVVTSPGLEITLEQAETIVYGRLFSAPSESKAPLQAVAEVARHILVCGPLSEPLNLPGFFACEIAGAPMLISQIVQDYFLLCQRGYSGRAAGGVDRLIPEVLCERDYEALEALIRLGPSLGTADLRGHLPLTRAIMNEDIQTVKHLIRAGALKLEKPEADAPANKRMMVTVTRASILLALEMKSLPMAEVLIEGGCNYDTADVLCSLVQREHFMDFDYLLAHEPRCWNSAIASDVLMDLMLYDRTPQWQKRAERVFRRGSTETNPPTLGKTVLHSALVSANVEKIRWCLDHGADVNHGGDYSNLFMQFGFDSDLGKGGLSPKWRDASNVTPLHIAAYVGNLALVCELIGSGADIHTKDSMGAMPIHYAMRAVREGSTPKPFFDRTLLALGLKELSREPDPSCEELSPFEFARMQRLTEVLQHIPRPTATSSSSESKKKGKKPAKKQL